MNVIRQEYRDFATPALAAGAVQKGRYWTRPGEARFDWPHEFCEANGIEPLRDPPKARSLESIRRASIAALHRGNTRTGRDGLAMRAMHYVLALQGVETKIDEFLYSAEKHCEFAKASDGSTRVRAVRIEGEYVNIPNWDFVATVTEIVEEPQGAFA